MRPNPQVSAYSQWRVGFCDYEAQNAIEKLYGEIQMHKIPEVLATNCKELNKAWVLYSKEILEQTAVLISDTEDDLNWHAFLGHSLDMQGFRAAEFAGVDAISKPNKDFKSLKTRGIGVEELGKLWEIDAVRNHLLHTARGTSITTTYEVLRAAGGKTGISLAEAFEQFPMRKGHWCVRGLLQNSAVLKEYGYSFRAWLAEQSRILGVLQFPPSDFRLLAQGGSISVEDALCKKLEQTFYMVGPEISPYMLCDWQMWLWRNEKTAVFDNFKLDSFHSNFVQTVNSRNGAILPADKQDFTKWWHGYYPALPPRLANECIWLYIEHGHLEQ
jgi:hypothetical protein